MKWWKKMAKTVFEPEEMTKLKKWQKKYEDAKSKYADSLNAMKVKEGYYNGTRIVYNKDGQETKKQSTYVRNISYELIESQVDPSIPQPKVIPIHEEDKEQAKIIEEFLKNEISLLDLKGLNDLQERTTPIQGGSFSLVEWDNTKGLHCTIGDISVQDLHPRQIIPQPGMTDIEKMDYIFVRTPQTKEYIKRRFGKSVEDEEETDKELREEVQSDDIKTLITVYYKNSKGGIGIYRWCGDVELEDLEDYEERHLTVCKKCGAIKEGDVCQCGSKSFVDRDDEMDIVTLSEAVEVDTTLSGEPVIAEKAIKIEIPFYKPGIFPIVLRKNISKDRVLLGCSDVEVIADQQETVKQVGTKVKEKILKGGSFVTLPTGLGVETTDEDLKVVRVDNPAQIQMITVLNVQPDISKDMAVMEQAYSNAKSALGITDAYQGKYDSSATSGAAKQYSINQAAGRLESKRVMKNRAYAKLYEYMFKLALAYADEPIPINVAGVDGEIQFAHFDKRMFLKKDAHGEWYWNDEFIFDIDPTSTLLTNREAMWNQADLKLQSGAFGPIGQTRTNHLYWLEQERNGYPNAGEIRREIDEQLAEEKQMQQMMQMGGMNNEMPIM